MLAAVVRWRGGETGDGLLYAHARNPAFLEPVSWCSADLNRIRLSSDWRCRKSRPTRATSVDCIACVAHAVNFRQLHVSSAPELRPAKSDPGPCASRRVLHFHCLFRSLLLFFSIYKQYGSLNTLLIGRLAPIRNEMLVFALRIERSYPWLGAWS